MNLELLAQILAACIALFAGIPQLVKSRKTSGRQRLLARLAGVLSLISAISLTLMVTGRIIESSLSDSMIRLLFLLPAAGALAAWTGSLIWAGPPTQQDRQTFIGAGFFVIATIIVMLLRG